MGDYASPRGPGKTAYWSSRNPGRQRWVLMSTFATRRNHLLLLLIWGVRDVLRVFHRLQGTGSHKMWCHLVSCAVDGELEEIA